MKIRLVQEGNIQILSVSGPVVDQNIEVLRAGIRKILNGGSHRIILELMSPDELSHSALEGIASLHQLTKKHLGDLAIVYPKVPKPPEFIMECHLNRESAIKHFMSNGRVVSELSALIASYEVEIKSLREKLRLTSGSMAVEQELTALKVENKTLKQRLEELAKAFRAPQTPQAATAKISTLEAELVRLRGVIHAFQVPNSDEAYAAKVAFLEEEVARLREGE